MTTKNLAVLRLTLSNKTSLHRDRDHQVKVVDEEGATVAALQWEDWKQIRDFFAEITHPEAML